MWRGKQWQFERPGAEDRTGDRLPGTTFTVGGCLYWTSTEAAEFFGRNAIEFDGVLAVPTDADVEVTDKPRSPDGQKYTITGRARWDEAHPLTQRRFPFKLFEVKGVR